MEDFRLEDGSHVRGPDSNTDEQGRQVTNSQFGHLVQLIMNARQ
jgi:hypothetical protein